MDTGNTKNNLNASQNNETYLNLLWAVGRRIQVAKSNPQTGRIEYWRGGSHGNQKNRILPMAIEFLRVQILTRGKSACGVPGHMAYRNCSRVYDEQAKRTFDYTKKKSVLDSFLVNAGGNTLEELANKMERAEKRKDAQVAREFILALPHELSLENNREICCAFVDLIVKKYNVATHVAIHKPDESREDETHRKSESLKNVHAHITVSTRAIDENGNIFGPKIRETNAHEYLDG